MQKKKLLIGCIVLVLVLVVAGVLYRNLSGSIGSDNLGSQTPQNENQQQNGENAPSLAPDFTVLDANGKEVKLSDFRGKPVVVNFWATWCGYCVKEMPAFEEVYQQMGSDIHFLMINVTDGVQETVDKASAFIADSGYTFPVYYDTQYSATLTYGAYSLPMTFFFDAEGYAIAQATGAIDKDTLLRGIEMITE